MGNEEGGVTPVQPPRLQLEETEGGAHPHTAHTQGKYDLLEVSLEVVQTEDGVLISVFLSIVEQHRRALADGRTHQNVSF